jgi:hypothetical protein
MTLAEVWAVFWEDAWAEAVLEAVRTFIDILRR